MDTTRSPSDPLKDPRAAQLLNDPAGLRALLSGPETARLMALLDKSAGGSLKSAAQAAAGGRPQALMDLLGKVMESREGAEAVARLQKKTGQE